MPSGRQRVLGDRRDGPTHCLRTSDRLQRRLQRQRGLGRDFERLREYREGADIRDLCWTAPARRGVPITHGESDFIGLGTADVCDATRTTGAAYEADLVALAASLTLNAAYQAFVAAFSPSEQCLVTTMAQAEG